MKYAVIKTGGKQYLITENQQVALEKLAGNPKSEIEFKEVLLVNDDQKVYLGNPLVKNAKVTATILEQKKDKKIRVAKFRAKSRYRKVKGHRQPITLIKINKISISSKKT